MTRVVRIIARLNIGGPAIQAITLTRELEAHGYETTLVRGAEGPHEGSMDPLADRLGVHPIRLSSLRRDPRAADDLRALVALVRILREVKPDLVHTHAAKAGTLGRVAVLLAFGPRRRPRVVHTYHGHSLTGYFSARTSAVYTWIERVLARVSDRLVAVSPEVRDELVALGVAGLPQFSVIPLGFDLRAFDADGPERAARGLALRTQLGLAPEHAVVTLVARLVPIKRVDRFLEAAAILARARPNVRFLIVGDGDERDALLAHPDALALGDRVTWTGFRSDIADILFASDVVVLTSDNEGTPVSLIEAQASGVPVVCTRVGGAATVLRDGITGVIVDRSPAAVAAALAMVLADTARAAEMGSAGRVHALAQFSLDRLTADIRELYRELGV